MSSTPHKKNVVENTSIQAGESIHIGDIIYNFNGEAIKIPHLLTNNIPTNTDHILGRDTEMQTITTHLAQNKPTVLVNGIGGIGKTSVAAKYVATYGDQYKHLAWLTVQSSVAEAFTNDVVLLKSLHIEQDVWQLIETQRLTDAFKLVMHELNTLEQTLVVLDNANNPDDLIAHKNLFDTAKCHYLITSRTQPQEWAIVEIDHLPPDEAVALFRKLAPSVLATTEELKSLLSKLFYHTLLIELVAKAVENAGFSFAELQTMVETKFIHDEQLNEDIVSTGKHGNSVTNNAKRAKIEEYIWLIFSNVKDLGDDAKQILRGMALLPVATPFDRAFLKEHLALFEVKDIVPNLSLLVEWGWLEKEQNKGFKMHPLIADVVVVYLVVDVGFAETYIEHISKLIYYNNENPQHNLFEINKNKLFAERLNGLFLTENTENMSYLLNNLGCLEKNFGFYNKAAEYNERALQIAESIFDKNHKTVAVRQSNLATIYGDLGYYERAALLLETVLANKIVDIDKDYHSIIVCQSNLAMAYHNLGQYERAATLLEITLGICEKQLDTDHPTVIICQSNLALIYKNTGQYDSAAKLLKIALTNVLKKFSSDHPSIAICKSNLAHVYKSIGRNLEAKTLWQEAYQNYLKNFGAKHPHTVQLKKYSEM